ncbi:purine-nucleoside phosphorylase [Helicobacter sp. 11S02596-1]|uniref:5'-methylthioadenosine/S-adenosylhomocysteine nucleosidase family protein n=1 Tax=Helicobacter sp. 11S02596-1 TaxID=1476194 RepID=UPI000BA67EE9|nr:purine-nucleoside phosphorylase [Helicobacter sp. 11S02596-1]PAF44797.1 purine-nucleoside phosphorylase [Helicobacter sp. 11S02596-1]
MFVCAGKSESFSFAQPIGIGLVASAMNLGKICSFQPIDSLVFLGTAGAYDPEIQVFDIFVSTCATQIEASYTTHQSYTPIDNHIQSESANVPRETKKIIVNSSNYIHTDPDFAKKMLRAGIALENMEFFSVLQVAQHFGIPCCGIFCVTNHCNENAHRDFLSHHDQAKEILETYTRNQPSLWDLQ